MKILVMNGPNLNLLGEREPSVYGDHSLAAINERLKECAEKNGAEIDFFQSNHEGALIECTRKRGIQASFGNLSGMQGYCCGIWRKELYDGAFLCAEYGLIKAIRQYS